MNKIRQLLNQSYDIHLNLCINKVFVKFSDAVNLQKVCSTTAELHKSNYNEMLYS